MREPSTVFNAGGQRALSVSFALEVLVFTLLKQTTPFCVAHCPPIICSQSRISYALQVLPQKTPAWRGVLLLRLGMEPLFRIGAVPFVHADRLIFGCFLHIIKRLGQHYSLY